MVVVMFYYNFSFVSLQHTEASFALCFMPHYGTLFVWCILDYNDEIFHTSYLLRYHFWLFYAQLSSCIPVLPPPCCFQLVPLWWPRCWLPWGRMFLGAGGWDHVPTAHSAFRVWRLYRHSGGTWEQTLSGHLQTRWAFKDQLLLTDLGIWVYLNK